MSALWQTIGYVLRILSIKHPASMGYYSGWFILILVRILRMPLDTMIRQLIAPGISTMDQRFRLHGYGKNGLQLHVSS